MLYATVIIVTKYISCICVISDYHKQNSVIDYVYLKIIFEVHH